MFNYLLLTWKDHFYSFMVCLLRTSLLNLKTHLCLEKRNRTSYTAKYSLDLTWCLFCWLYNRIQVYVSCAFALKRLWDQLWSQPKGGPRQANLVLIACASSEGSGEPAHPRSLARTSAARSYRQWVKRNLQTESQIPGPSEWLGMRSSNLSWRNARRHKFAWRGSGNVYISV